MVATGARGSSDHAATYGKTLIETRLGVPVASIGPSVASLYATKLRLRDTLFVAVSQSGGSPDLLSLARAARAGGALSIALVNDEASPLAQACEIVVPLCAGAESSVAATKTCLAGFLAFLQLVAHWQDDAAAIAALRTIPDWLDSAVAMDWRPGLSPLATASSLRVVARGLGLGAAHEMALKCQETCQLLAASYSAAEVLHGPMAAIRPGGIVLGLTQTDATEAPTRETLRTLAAQGASVIATAETPAGAGILPLPGGVPAAIAPLAMLQSFYLAIPRIAAARGLDAARPAHLRKVTRTL